MRTHTERGLVPWMLLAALMLFSMVLTGCGHHNEHGGRDRYGYYETRDVSDDPTDNAAIRHERRGHGRWRP